MPFALQPSVERERRVTEARVRPLRDVRVLVVDDNRVNLGVLGATLARWGMTPVLAESGRAAVTAILTGTRAATPFPLVLVDAQMPEMDGFAVAQAIAHDPQPTGATVLMLTSGGQRGDAARCRALGVRYLTKPISAGELLDGILVALGNPPAPPGRPAFAGGTSEDVRRTLRILLAEDNAVNQMVASRLLEKRGHTVTIARNGREALAALETASAPGAHPPRPFDVVLMDLQMPEMNGLEATAIIRAEEKTTGAHVPIIAMTANAMKGDKERCLAAGMDGYVAKPFDVEDVFAVIDRVLL
jgi:CheY-like chemotaxis protein